MDKSATNPPPDVPFQPAETFPPADEIILVCGDEAIVYDRVDEESLSDSLKQSLTIIEATKVHISFEENHCLKQNLTLNGSTVQMSQVSCEENHCFPQRIDHEASKGQISQVSFEESQFLPQNFV